MDSRPLERETKENEPENIRKQYIVPAIDRLLPPLLPPLFPQPSRNELHKYLATDGIRRYDAARAFNRGKRYRLLLAKYCLRSIYLLSPFLLPYPSSIPSSSTNRKIFLLGGKLRLSPDVEEMNFFLDKSNIYARWGRREKLPVLEMLDVLSDNKRSVVGRSSTG